MLSPSGQSAGCVKAQERLRLAQLTAMNDPAPSQRVLGCQILFDWSTHATVIGWPQVSTKSASAGETLKLLSPWSIDMRPRMRL